MVIIDYIVILGYLLGLLVVGGIFSLKVKDSMEMFAAGRQSPWWVSGLSGYMTIFSAGTFVVWGGIAFRLGMVGVSILVTSGIGTVIAGYLLAERWHKMGVSTPAEFIKLRFDDAALHVYTWLTALPPLLGQGVALYAMSKIVAALVPLEESNFLCDPQTGHLSVAWTIVICGVVVLAYTIAGGLWAVLMTDVIQFVVLSLAVAVVVPLSLMQVGGLEGFISRVPDNFFAPVAGEFTYAFLFLWIISGFFIRGGQWAFVQRYICVPTPRDARKSAYLMGGLYLVSPILWMFPAMAYRILNPDADPEDAYILCCQSVLPAGMLGMVLAAMFSATASMISSQLNVFAGVFTRDLYRPLMRPDASEAHLVQVGRIFTFFYGAAIIGIALAVPFMGGAENVVLSLVMLFYTPLVIPAVWGVFSRRIGRHCIWWVPVITGIFGGFLKFIFGNANIVGDAGVFGWIQDNMRVLEAAVGLIIPVGLLVILDICTKTVDAGWTRLTNAILDYQKQDVVIVKSSTLPALMVAWSLGILGLVTTVLVFMAESQKMVLIVFAVMLFLLAGGIVWYCYHKPAAGVVNKG